MWCLKCRYGSEACRGAARCPQCGTGEGWQSSYPFPLKPTGMGRGPVRKADKSNRRQEEEQLPVRQRRKTPRPQGRIRDRKRRPHYKEYAA